MTPPALDRDRFCVVESVADNPQGGLVHFSGIDSIDAAEGIRRLEAFYRALGLSTTLRENGIGDADFGRMAGRAVAMAGGTLGQFVPLKAADCEAIYRLAL